MVGLIVVVAAVVIMTKAAEMEGRSTVLWGAITFILCLLCSIFIPLPLINIVIGLVISYLAMFAVKLIAKG
jgi:hypothetical protein